LSDLRITPAEAIVGDIVTVNVQASNNGDVTSKYTLNVKMNGAVVVEAVASIEAQNSYSMGLKINVTKAGTYTISIEDLDSPLIVKELPKTSSPAVQPSSVAKTSASPVAEPSCTTTPIGGNSSGIPVY
jgi:hypothetical protein